MDARKTKMIVCDLDDTLLKKDKTISDYTLSVLRRCMAQNIKVVFATARSEKAASAMIEQIDVDVLVSSGGARIRVSGLILDEAWIPSAMADELISKAIKEYDITEVTILGEKSRFTNNAQRHLDAGLSHYSYNAFSELPHENAYKITLRYSSEDAIHRILEQFPLCSFVSYTGEDMGAVLHKRAKKEVAIQTLCAHYHIDIEDVIAFGDDNNDTQMLKCCGFGVAVANAIDRVKSVADAMCASNEEDGVAKWIEEWVLSP